MARKLFEKQGIRTRTGPLASGTVFVVYSDSAGTVEADIAASSGGAAISGSTVTVADIASLGPSALKFWGPPAGTDTLYLRCPADTSLGVQEIEADEDERLDALEAGAAGIPGTIFDAKGDLIAASAADTAARLAVGTADSKLTPDSTQATGLRWQVNEGPRNPMSAVYGAVGDGATDDTAAFTALLASFGSRGGEIELPARTFHIPGGITESINGLSVRGLGHRAGSNHATEVGAVIVSTTTGAWCWTHDNAVKASFNNYRGPKFDDVVFQGDADTGGGLRIYSAYSTVNQCSAVGHTTGTGFLWEADGAGSDDVSWAHVEGCHAINCLTGYDMGGDELLASASIIGCFTLKTTGGGILHTGTGFKLKSDNTTVLGGKTENDAIGWEVTANSGVTLTGCRAEDCTTGWKFNRASDPGFSSRIRLTGAQADVQTTTPVEIGANQIRDMVVGCSFYQSITDNGSGTVVLGDVNGDMILRRTAAGKLISLGVTAESGALVAQTTGVDLDVSMLANADVNVKLGSADANSFFGVLDTSAVQLFRVFGNSQVSMRRPTDTSDRITLDVTNRVINFGPGNAATDVNLGRSVADVLYTDDTFQIGRGLREGLQAHSTTGSTETFDALTASVHTATLDANCTFTFTGAAASIACQMTLILTQDGTGSRIVTWPASVKWAAAVAPTLSTGAGKVDTLTFVSTDGGTTWYGFISGLDLR